MKIMDASQVDDLEPPAWFTERTAQLMRLMSSSPMTVANGLWFELLKRGMVGAKTAPERELSWVNPIFNPTINPTTNSNTIHFDQVNGTQTQGGMCDGSV